MKIIKELPIDGSVVINIDRRYANGHYGDVNWRKADKIVSEVTELHTSVISVMQFVENYAKVDEEEDAPTASYGDIDYVIKNGYVIQDDAKEKPKSWRHELVFDTLIEAIEHVVGDVPCRDGYVLRSNGVCKGYHDDFRLVVEAIYQCPEYTVEGMDTEEEKYIDNLKQYLMLLKLSQ